MKRILTLAAALVLAWAAAAQENLLDRKVTLNVQDTPLEEVLTAVMRQTDVLFLYRSADLGASRRITLEVKDQPLRTVLDRLTEGAGVDYVVDGRHIILRKRAQPAATPETPRRNTRITGTVRDRTGEPLVGATVMVHGSSTGTSTDLDGNFTLEATGDDLVDVLLIGYRTWSAPALPRMQVVLEEDVTLLDEVVVVGYGTQKKVNLTGSVEALGGDKIENLPMPSLSRGLQGLIPSLNIDMTDGKPIRSSEYNVRGTTSIGAGGGSTLIMIDGAPATRTC